MSPHSPKLEAIFSAALERQTEAEREAYLDRVCARAPELRERVEALVEAHEGVRDFLETPAATPRPPTSTPAGEEPGQDIGPYRLLERLGEGGFGVVWRAQQTEPVRREVAIKIIKLGMDTEQVIARFEVERQALALTDHPNIARVLDAGATETGRPYFVMELVRGVSMSEYCDTHRLNLRQRLELFLDVCRAVQHAHQKGLIHRDLKPTNVLVAISDQRPVPKVIDFGVAKATHQRLTARTLFTERGQLIGTPVYMSPEQAEMSGLDVDTRADIYSLGAMLYEQFTGTTPFEARRLREVGLGEVQRIIREEEPAPPSQRVASMGPERKDHALRRRQDPAHFAQRLRGDLDWIVMKALEKDRTRRYATADALADDVRRYLANEPVLAGAPSTLYRLRKFVRRNRVAVLAGTAVATALFIGAGAAASGFVRAQREARIAKDRSEFWEKVVDRDFADLQGAEVLREAGVVFAPDHPVVSAILLMVAEQAREVGDLDRSEELYGLAIERLAELHAEPHLNHALALARSGSLLADRGEPARAETQLRAALDIGAGLGDEGRAALTESREELAALLRMRKDFEGAVEQLRLAVEARRSAFPDQHDKLSRTLETLADTLKDAGQTGEAAEAARQAVAELELAYPDSVRTADTRLAYGLVLKGLGNRIQAVQELSAGIAFYDGHPGLRGERYVAGVKALSDLLAERPDADAHAEADRLDEELLDVARRLYGPLELADLLDERAQAAERRGALLGALKLNDESLGIRQGRPGSALQVEQTLLAMGRLLSKIAQGGDAPDEAYALAMDFAETLLLRNPERLSVQRLRDLLEFRLQHAQGSEQGLEAIAERDERLSEPSDHPLDLARLSMAHHFLGNGPLAAIYLRGARERAQAALYRDDPLVQSVIREASALIGQ